MEDKQQDDSIKDRIIGLLQKGYTRGQLISDFNFAERTVDAAIKAYKEISGDDPQQKEKGNDTEAKTSALPPKLDGKQVIVPEYLIGKLSFVDGDKRQAFIDGMLVLEVARRTVMEDIIILQGWAEAQAKMTETQLNILRAAKSESSEVAERAAKEVAAQFLAYLEKEKTSIDDRPNPMASMMVELMRPAIMNMMSRFVPGMQGGQVFQKGAGFGVPPGWTVEQEE